MATFVSWFIWKFYERDYQRSVRDAFIDAGVAEEKASTAAKAATDHDQCFKKTTPPQGIKTRD